MQILRLVPRRPAGQTAGIDPKLLFVAKNGTPQIDVKHPLRIAVLDASIGRIATLQKPQGKGRNPIHTGSSEGPSKPADVDPTTMPKVMRMRKSMRALGQGACFREASSQGKRYRLKQIVCAGLWAALHRPRVKRRGFFVSRLCDRRVPQRHICFVHHEIERTLPKRAVGVTGRLVRMAQDTVHLRRQILAVAQEGLDASARSIAFNAAS